MPQVFLCLFASLGGPRFACQPTFVGAQFEGSYFSLSKPSRQTLTASYLFIEHSTTNQRTEAVPTLHHYHSYILGLHRALRTPHRTLSRDSPASNLAVSRTITLSKTQMQQRNY
jgi:hypothetical protein